MVCLCSPSPNQPDLIELFTCEIIWLHWSTPSQNKQIKELPHPPCCQEKEIHTPELKQQLSASGASEDQKAIGIFLFKVHLAALRSCTEQPSACCPKLLWSPLLHKTEWRSMWHLNAGAFVVNEPGPTWAAEVIRAISKQPLCLRAKHGKSSFDCFI